MPKKFYIAWNRDSDTYFCKALLDAGYQGVGDPAQADFILHDAVHPGLDSFVKAKPTFIYPHTPQSWFLWDGVLTPGRCDCNFVSGEAGVIGMKSYGYPYRVETVGFTRCEVREFTPTTGNDLLIVPAHAQRNGQYTYPDYLEYVYSTLRFVLANRSAFGNVVLRWNERNVDPALLREMQEKAIRYEFADPYNEPSPLAHMIRRIERADLVLGCNTSGCVAVALGKPTVFFSERRPRSTPRDALHADLYWDLVRFPLRAEDMSIEELLAVRTCQNSKAELWKRQNIGGNFNAEKFIAIVKEFA